MNPRATALSLTLTGALAGCVAAFPPEYATVSAVKTLNSSSYNSFVYAVFLTDALN